MNLDETLKPLLERYIKEEGTDWMGGIRDTITALRHLAQQNAVFFPEVIQGSLEVYSEEIELECEGHVSARVHSDDHNAVADFNAAPWLAKATWQEIETLADCDWSGDYPADEVALQSQWDDNVRKVFEYVQGTQGTCAECGSECHVNEDEAREWLANYRKDVIGIQFEYSLSYTGGNFNGVGLFVVVPLAVIEQHDTPEDAFQAYTHKSKIHVIRYSPDELKVIGEKVR